MSPTVRQPTQRRARETRGKLLEAAARLFGDLGFERATTHAIAEAAGVSVGSLYAYFEDKEALLLELFDQHAAQLFAIVQEPFREATAATFDPRAAIRHAVDTSVRCLQHDPRLHRVFVAMERHPLLLERWRRWELKGLEALRALLDIPAEGTLRIADKESAAFIVYHAVMIACGRCMLHGEGPGEEALINGLTDMVTRFLLKE